MSRQSTSSKFLLFAAMNLALSPALSPAALAEPTANNGAVRTFPGAQPIINEDAAAKKSAAETKEIVSEKDHAEAAPTEKSQSMSETAAEAESEMDKAAARLSSIEQKEAAQEMEIANAQASASEHYFLGNHYFGKWDMDLAEVELDQAVKYSPDLRVAHRDLCLVSLAKLNVPRALAEFMMVTGIGEAVPYTAAEKTELDGKAKKLHYKKALEYGSKQNWHEAVSELQWALGYAPNDSSIHHSLAFAYATQGDFVNAEAEYEKTFAANPTDGNAHADYANLLANKGHLDQAQTEMQKAVDLTPKAAAYHVDLGWLAESRNDLGTATQEFEEAVRLSPNHAGLWAHLGRLLEKSGKSEQAAKAYSKALSLDPSSAEALQNLSRLKHQKPSGDIKPHQVSSSPKASWIAALK